MATIAIATNGRTALLSSYVELGRRLARHGHRVVYVAETEVATGLTERGEEAVALDHDRRFDSMAAADPPPSGLRPAALVRWVARRRNLRARSVREGPDEVAAAVASLDPDLVILDAEFQLGLLATPGIEAPRAMAVTFFSIFRGPDLPPLDTMLGPPTSPVGRARIRLAWAWNRARGLAFRAARRCSRGGLATLVRPIRLDTNDLADLRAIARVRDIDLSSFADRSQWLRPHLVRDLPLFCLNAAEMDLPHRVSPRLIYLGPMVVTDRPEPAMEPDARSQWEALVASRQGATEPRPLVYATLGTYWSADRDTLATFVEVFRRRPDWDLVIGLGGVTDPDELGQLPANVVALRWAPQLEILAQADAVLTHGGTATVREAIAFGVPSVVCSTGFVDQHSIAARVRHHRLGLIADLGHDGPEQLEAKLAAALTDPDIADGVAAMRSTFNRYDDEDLAVAAIERFLAIHSPRSNR